MAGYNYIAIEGPPGANKTLLSNILAKKMNAKIISNGADENPFLERFLKNPATYAFSTQMFFLLEQYTRLSDMLAIDLFHNAIISEFIFEHNEIYANLTLSPAEIRLFHRVEGTLRKDFPLPQLVIFLNAPVEILLRNILKNSPQYQQRISEEFLKQLVDLYLEFFFRWEKTPLLIVDSSTIRWNNNESLEQLIKFVLQGEMRGIQYYSGEEIF